MIVDTHVHVWQPGDGHRVLIRERAPALDADFGFTVLQPDLKACGVSKVILVSAAQSYAETERLLQIADRFPDLVGGVIGFLDVDAADFEDRLDEACAHKSFVGLRFPLVVFDDHNWISRKPVMSALDLLARRGLVAQILASTVHLALCADMLCEHQKLKIVIDHAGNPGAHDVDAPMWRDGLAELGSRTTAICKVGNFAIGVEPMPDHKRCTNILEQVIASFGPNRLIYGSNWPVSLAQQPYASILPSLHSSAQDLGLDSEVLDRLMTQNALRMFARSA
jgi:L-fuconolactonase